MGYEIWKDVKGYEGLYQVSNIGKVKSLHYNKEKILADRFDKKGYLSVRLFKNGKSKIFKTHRLVAQAFIPNPINKEQVNHINGVKSDNRVENLEWCTNYENCVHAHLNGLVAKPNPHRCEDAYNSKLKVDDVIYIRKNYVPYSKEFNSTKLSKKFNVSTSLVLSIAKGERWKYDEHTLQRLRAYKK